MFVHALASTGGRQAHGRKFGEKIVDGLLRDSDVLELLPRLLRMWEPGRFPTRRVACSARVCHIIVRARSCACVRVRVQFCDATGRGRTLRA